MCSYDDYDYDYDDDDDDDDDGDAWHYIIFGFVSRPPVLFQPLLSAFDLSPTKLALRVPALAQQRVLRSNNKIFANVNHEHASDTNCIYFSSPASISNQHI